MIKGNIYLLITMFGNEVIPNMGTDEAVDGMEPTRTNRSTMKLAKMFIAEKQTLIY